jgi:hypothetical protein
MSANTTGDLPNSDVSMPEPWQSWDSTVRYVIVQVSHVLPTAVLLWQTCLHH